MVTVHCPCPNCGSKATRTYFSSREAFYHRCAGHQMIQTECPACDYLMVMCARNGIVIEAYAPSTSAPVNHCKLLKASSEDSKQQVFC